MARARNIKPSFFVSEQLADQEPLGRLLFIGLWTLADYKGDLEWKERTIKVQLLPFDNCSVKELAINLDKSGLIRFYSVGERIFVNIPNFEKHQNPHKNEKLKGSDIPGFSNNARQLIDINTLTIIPDKSGQVPNENGTHPADSLLLNPDSPILNPDSLLPPGGDGAAAPPATKPRGITDEQFDVLWSAYPKRSGSNPKDKARKALNARIAEGEDLRTIAAGLDRYRQHCLSAGKINTEFIMQAVRFFGPSKEYLNEWEAPNGKRDQHHRPTAGERRESALDAAFGPGTPVGPVLEGDFQRVDEHAPAWE